MVVVDLGQNAIYVRFALDETWDNKLVTFQVRQGSGGLCILILFTFIIKNIILKYIVLSRHQVVEI